jgi:aquaporin Z
MKKNLTELIGTFVLVFTVGCAAASGNNFAPFAVAAALTAVIYAGFGISGAHYNPVTTLAVFLCKKIERQDAIMYVVFQFIGGIFGAFSSYIITDNSANAIAMAPGSASPMNALFAEVLGTFALIYVILSVALVPSKAKNEYYGLAIGAVVLGIAISLGGISGGAFNPAVGLGRCLASLITDANDCFSMCWLYVVGPILGSIAATFTFLYLNATEIDAEAETTAGSAAEIKEKEIK